MQSNTFEMTSKDLLISQLRKELVELKQQTASFNELSEKLTNTEFTLQILNSEKNSMECEAAQKSEQNLKVISQLRSEVDLLSRKLTTEESRNKLTKNGIQEFELEINRLREQQTILQKENSVLTENSRENQIELKK